MSEVMNGFQRRKEQKKASIRQAALELFSKHGFNKVSMNDIAARARVSHVTIYNHFGNKEELIQDTVQSSLAALTEKTRAIVDGDIPFMEKLELIILGEAELASQYHGELMRMALRDNPKMQEFSQSLWQQQINSLIMDLVEEGKILGYVAKELSQEAILYYFEVIRRGSMASTDLLAEIKTDAKFIRELYTLFFFGLVDK